MSRNTCFAWFVPETSCQGPDTSASLRQSRSAGPRVLFAPEGRADAAGGLAPRVLAPLLEPPVYELGFSRTWRSRAVTRFRAAATPSSNGNIRTLPCCCKGFHGKFARSTVICINLASAALWGGRQPSLSLATNNRFLVSYMPLARMAFARQQLKSLRKRLRASLQLAVMRSSAVVVWLACRALWHWLCSACDTPAFITK